MRTTVDLPPELMRAAKIAAAERGVTLKELFVHALSREVGGGASGTGRRVELPLVRWTDPTASRLDISYAEMDAALDAEDAQKYAP